jgi:CRP-like cAMP-binding protein
MAVSDVAAQAVLNRVIAPASIGPVTGLMESGKLLFEGSACLLAPALVLAFGIRSALVVAGLVVALIVAGGTRAFQRIDRRAVGRAEISHLLTAVKLFHGLRMDVLEGVVAQLRPLDIAPGQDVLTQGVRDHGGWYLVQQGQLEVLIDGFVVNELARGDGFGELALLRDRPRAATVRTRTQASLLTLERDAFLTAVGGGDIALSGDFDIADASTEDPVELLAGTPLLAGVGPGAVSDLAHRAVVREVAAGSAIVTEGEFDDEFHVLVTGRAAVTVGGERRRELLPGDGFGEIAVLHRVPRSATVVAEQNCSLLTVAGDDLRAAVAARGGLVAKMAAAATPETSADVAAE